jgi:hypothetical protein
VLDVRGDEERLENPPAESFPAGESPKDDEIFVVGDQLPPAASSRSAPMTKELMTMEGRGRLLHSWESPHHHEISIFGRLFSTPSSSSEWKTQMENCTGERSAGTTGHNSEGECGGGVKAPSGELSPWPPRWCMACGFIIVTDRPAASSHCFCWSVYVLCARPR